MQNTIWGLSKYQRKIIFGEEPSKTEKKQHPLHYKLDLCPKLSPKIQMLFQLIILNNTANLTHADML